jgi:tetraacyldisaccharide 4'-kinase
MTTLDPHRYGDEPVLIKKRLPHVEVIVGGNRYDNAIRNDVDVFVLDDAFQHLQLHRDLDVVVDNPAASFLREGREALRFADIVLSRNLKVTIPDSLRGKRVFAFSALADNDQFFDSLDLDIAGTLSFPDHHRYTSSDIKEIKRAARDAGATAMVTTEKDAVKIDDPEIVPIAAEFVIAPADLERIVSVAVR